MKKIAFILLLAALGSSLPSQQTANSRQFLKSALVPGWGELSLHRNSGYVFLAAEILLWSSVFYFDQETDLKERGSLNYAIKYAHIDPQGDFGDEYYYHLSKYKSSGFETGGYNAHIVEEAMAKFPDDPAAQSAYILENSYSDDFFWDWDDKNRKHDYAIMRKRMTEYKNYIKGITGGIIANHLISAINTMLLSRKLKRVELGWEFNSEMDPMLKVSYKF